jgi:putative transposase
MQTMIPLSPGGYFHIYDRGVNRKNIFYEARNYAYFLSLYIKYIVPVVETYAYCLLPNHFHLLARIRSTAGLQAAQVSKAYNNLLSTYAKAINKRYDRTGPLFQHHFGRIPITSNRYFASLIRYIHRNPQKHGLVEDFRDWPYSSYHVLLSSEPTLLARAKVFKWLNGRHGYTTFHSRGEKGKKIFEYTGNDLD